jgi:hypothetical protein
MFKGKEHAMFTNAKAFSAFTVGGLAQGRKFCGETLPARSEAEVRGQH